MLILARAFHGSALHQSGLKSLDTMTAVFTSSFYDIQEVSGVMKKLIALTESFVFATARDVIYQQVASFLKHTHREVCSDFLASRCTIGSLISHLSMQRRMRGPTRLISKTLNQVLE